MKISQSAFDLIVAEEVSSQAYYVRHYQHPEWPGGASGITIAIGYDLGYAKPDKIRADWAGRVSPDVLLIMMRCSGVTGQAARGLLPEVKSGILIPWDSAIAVFSERDMPQWTAVVLRACPGAENLTPTCLGVIVSIAYNRGAGGFNSGGDRYAEMRSIKLHINGMTPAIPADIRSMKRLWPNVSGLRARREHEAALFQIGLTTIEPDAMVTPTPVMVDPDISLTAGPARTKPPATTTTQNTTTGALVLASGAAASHAASLGYNAIDIALIVILGLAIASAVWITWYRQRNP